MNRRRLLLGVAGSLAVGAVSLASGALAGVVPVEALVALLGNDYLFVAAIAGGALLLALLLAGQNSGASQVEVPDPEGTVTVPAPGDEFAATVDSWWLAVPFVSEADRRAVRERLRAAAVGAVARTQNCSPTRAADRVREGTWTDDDCAASFLAVDESRGGEWLTALGRGQTPFAYRARRTADAIAALDDPGGRSS